MLPAELIDHIFSFLRGDLSALEACSKAHPSYSRLAERHLYADIIVRSEDSLTVSELFNQLSKNSRFLDYARTLEIIPDTTRIPALTTLSTRIMLMVPQMSNLVYLKISRFPNLPMHEYEQFLSMFRNCLHQSTIEELFLSEFHDFPLSVLNNSKSIKTLTLSGCMAITESPSTSDSSCHSLQTLIIEYNFNSVLVSRMTRWVTHLTSLELWFDSESYPALLAACSNSLRFLYLNMGETRQSKYIYPANHHGTYHSFGITPCQDIAEPRRWINDHQKFFFTLSTLKSLETLFISAVISPSRESTLNKIHCALPAIMRLIKTAPPSIQTIVLNFLCRDVGALVHLDWSLLDLGVQTFHTDVGTGIRCPRIELRLREYTRAISDESVLHDLEGNEVLMDLVNRDLVILRAG